jgi:hypothetical protein
MSEVRWGRVNSDPVEYAIQRGPHGDEFVKLLDGSCLHRPLSSPSETEIEALRRDLDQLQEVVAALVLGRQVCLDKSGRLRAIEADPVKKVYPEIAING